MHHLSVLTEMLVHSNMVNVTVTLANNASILCSLSVLGVYASTLGRGSLNAGRLFTIATTVNLLNTPLNTLGEYALASS